MIIRLHGYTDTTSWNLNWYNEPIVSEDPCIVFTPKSMSSRAWGDSWDDVYPYPLRISLQIIDSLRTEYNIDTTRIYIHGSSMGGYGVFNLLYLRPDMFAAAFAICGGGDPESAELVMQTPLWIFHGSDDDVVPVERLKEIYERIIESGGEQTRYTEYPGVGHDVWTPAWKESTLVTWFLAQKRGKFYEQPDDITNFRYEFLNPTYVKLSWNTVVSVPRTNNWIWYLKLYRNFELIKELDSGVSEYIDSDLAEGTHSYYSIRSVSYYLKKSGEEVVYVVYPE